MQVGPSTENFPFSQKAPMVLAKITPYMPLPSLPPPPIKTQWFFVSMLFQSDMKHDQFQGRDISDI